MVVWLAHREWRLIESRAVVGSKPPAPAFPFIFNQTLKHIEIHLFEKKSISNVFITHSSYS